MIEPVFPPLFSGQSAEGADPFDAARSHAVKGCDAGLVLYDLGADMLRAALVFAPDVTLKDAMAMGPICGVGFQNALGALAPPEVAVQFEWGGGIRVNGGSCGRLRVGAASHDPSAEPDWLVVGLEVSFWPENDDPGKTPDRTALYSEGCADVGAIDLLESWVRHTLVGINTWADEGAASLHRDWSGLAFGVGEDIEINGLSGKYLGIDEHFGLLLRTGSDTQLIAMTELLEDN